uniref:Uncharacterized protein n=1 Tax=Rhizophora mucronata TaxID=61149 RepID=A0A2P2N4R0_RHIMU
MHEFNQARNKKFEGLIIITLQYTNNQKRKKKSNYL